MENDKEEKKPTPPSPDKFKVEQEWADRLGMDFESERARYEAQQPQQQAQQQPQLPPTPDNRPPQPTPVPPVYSMPPASQLPSMHPDGPMPPTYMVWAILSTIFCCLPAGVVAIVFSSMVSTKYFARDYEGARRASHKTEIWIITSIVVGVIFNALYMPLSLMIP